MPCLLLVHRHSCFNFPEVVCSGGRLSFKNACSQLIRLKISIPEHLRGMMRISAVVPRSCRRRSPEACWELRSETCCRFAWDATHLENPICQVELQILLDTKCRFRIVCSDHSLVVVVYPNAIGFPTWLSIALPYGPRLLPTRAKHVETRRVKFFADDVRDSSIYPTSSIKIKTCCHSYLAECFGIKSCLKSSQTSVDLWPRFPCFPMMESQRLVAGPVPAYPVVPGIAAVSGR